MPASFKEITQVDQNYTIVQCYNLNMHFLEEKVTIESQHPHLMHNHVTVNFQMHDQFSWLQDKLLR